MITIRVCVGSACHLKGSYDVIKIFMDLIEAYKISDKIEIKGSFCLGHCSSGVSIKLEDSDVISINPETAEDFFKETILGGLLNENYELLCSEL